MGKGSSAKAEVTEYRMSIHFGVALRLDSVNKILVDEKVAWSGTASANTTLTIDRPDLFGGERKEGGLVGAIDVLLGADDQVLPTSVASRYGLTPSDCPAFRGLTTLMFRGSGQVTTGEFNNWDEFAGEWNGNIGNNGFLWKHNTPLIAQKVEVEGTCAPVAPALNQAYAMIGDQANPIHMLYELLTDDEFGMGGSPDAINTASYDAAAETLFNEAFGLTILWMRQTKIETLTQEILDHIQASQYVDTNTGLWTVKLYRDDYDVEDLFAISPTNAKLSSYRIRSGGEIVNEMAVSWTNPESEKSESITGQNIASIVSQGGEKVSGSRNYYGVRSAELARKLLERDLREASAPLISCEAVVDRSAWNLAPGSVVLLDWPRRNVYGVVMRVGSVNYGRPGDSKIRVPLVQDVFSLARPPIVVDPGTGWVNPSAAPSPLTMQLTTLPAYFSRNPALQTEFVSLTEPEVLVMSLADSQDDDSLDYELMADTVGPTGATVPLSRGAKSMTPLAYLATSLSAAATSELPAALFPDINWSPSIGGFIWLGAGDEDQEIALVTGRTTTGWTIDRGCLDTVPRTWSTATPVWAVNAGSSIVDTQVTHGAGDTATYRGLDRTSQGLLAYVDAPAESLTLTARPHLPLRPANVTVGGVAFGAYAIGGATSFTVAWATRSRLLEDSQVLSWTDGPVLPEYRQETIIRAYDVATGDMVLEYGYLWLENSVTFLKADFARYASVRFEVLSRRDDLESLTGHSVIVTGFANNPAAALPPAPPERTVPPSSGAAPAADAFTATATTDTGPSGTQIPTLTIAGTQDNPDASALVTRYRQVGAADWLDWAPVTLVNEAVAFEITGVQSAATYEVEVAYIAYGYVGQYRALVDVTVGTLTAGDVVAVGGRPVVDLVAEWRELPSLISEAQQAAENALQEALDRNDRLTAEATARAAGLMAEAAARGVAIAGVEDSISTVATDLGAEVTTREEQYAATSATVALHTTQIDTNVSAIAAETAARTTLTSSVNVRNRTFLQATAPTSPVGGYPLVAGDLWADSDDNNQLYRWSGSAWVASHDVRGETALAEITAARNGSANLNAQLTAMRTTTADGLALRATTTDLTTLTSSVNVRNRTFLQATAPTSPVGGYPLVAGDLWADSDDNNQLYRWSGSAWVASHDVRGETALAEITAARNGSANLNAELTEMRTTVADGLAGRASAASVTALQVTIDTPLTGLSARTSALQAVTADLTAAYEDARIEFSATTGGGAAILRLASNTYGTIAGISADEIYFGANTSFDDATDTLRTTTGSTLRIIALGAAFGTDSTLMEWEGPSATAFASMSRANAYHYTANATPFSGGSRRLIGTVNVENEAISKEWRYDSVSLSSFVANGAMTTRTTMYNLTLTATGKKITFEGKWLLRARHSQDDWDLHVVVERLGVSGGTVDVFESERKAMPISGDGYITDWQHVSFSDTPPTGSVSYRVAVFHTYVIGGPGAFVDYDVSNRILAAREHKTEA